MKKFFMVAVMAVAALTANAQTSEVGAFTLTPYAGISNVIDTKKVNDQEMRGRIGFTGGVEAGYQAASWFKPSVGLQYMSLNFKDENLVSGATQNYTSGLLAVPVLANFYVANGLALKVGVEPAFLLSASTEGADVKSDLKSVNLFIPVGISYEYCNIVLDGRVNIATSKILKSEHQSDSDERNTSNSFVQLTLGYKFEL